MLQLLGYSVSGMLMLVCFLYEERHHVRSGQPRRPIFSKYRLTLGILFLLLLGFDILIAAVSIGGYYGHATYNDIIVIFMIICVPLQIGASVFYLFQVRHFPYALFPSRVKRLHVKQ